MDCEPDYFFIYDDFTILGNIEINRKNVILANNVHYWGASTSRATSRFLLFLDNGTFLGMYSGIVFNPTRIEIIGQRIIIPVDDPEIGNVIDFSAGIPNEVWIDGHIFSYTEINSIGH
ncbi:MAG: hypothetical protein LBI28_03810 [Treponema sp.]|jgi:hypothetical protein|nr:hypothetical protein [Treponema sp.]